MEVINYIAAKKNIKKWCTAAICVIRLKKYLGIATEQTFRILLPLNCADRKNIKG
ncbi:hypothetical protein ALHIDCOG_00245 [Klebsiella phage CPRSB]|nr:hypothetical protein ALHIDCOG_00245 [Klebsiella phage CPRSB]